MTKEIKFDYSYALPFVKETEFAKMEPKVSMAHEMLQRKNGLGNQFLGWLDWPIYYDQEEYARIKQTAVKIADQADALIVIGIGGSYLGARAALEMLSHAFYNQLPVAKRKTPEIYFLGNQLSGMYLAQLLEILEGKEIAVNVISKSGTTTEPAVAFRFMRAYIEEKYGKVGAKERIYVTTDKQNGALKQMADEEGYTSFVIPDDIGGRYSVLTAVGLLPIAAAGIDLDQIMAGARVAYQLYQKPSITENSCYQYAALRNLLYAGGKNIELLVNYEPSIFKSFSEWWKQLFGESEGKEHKGIFPAAVGFTTDLHSMGQYIQEGRRALFETVLQVETIDTKFVIKEDAKNLDGLNFLAGTSLESINKRAMEGTVLAHTDGGVPNLMIRVPEVTPYYFGQLIYFFEKACAISGYLLGINPFNQPGVEAYKKNMFALLEKPGFEKERGMLEARLQKKKCHSRITY